MKVLFTLVSSVICLVCSAQQSVWQNRISNANIFSSPRSADLNQDGVKDIVVGAGIESVPSENGVLAFDGSNGNVLWTVSCRTQLYTSPLFQDITGDKTPDVFIAGRDATFYAIDGRSGKVIWEFWSDARGPARKEGWLNFFAVQWIDDQNKDGYADLLTTNGGDYLAAPQQKNRPTAQLMVLSGKDGSILASAKLPEKKESYYAPHSYKDQDGETMVVFGTGGETIGGSLWEIPLKKLMQGNISRAELIMQDEDRGFILNTVLTDVTNDGYPDLLNARMNSAVSALDGTNFKMIWEHSFEGYECYVTPSIGQLCGDQTPDLFTIMARGTFPMYTEFMLVVFDGATGKIAYQQTSGFNQFSPAVLADLNGDGKDEIIYVENTLLNMEQFLTVNQVKVVDITINKQWYVGPVREGVSMAASPLLEDLNGDGSPELVVATSSIVPEGKQPFSMIECINLNQSNMTIHWNGYLGPNGNGNY